MHHISDHMQDCIKLCNDCHDTCEQTLFQHCLEEGGKHIEPKHVQLMADCAEICQAAANFMLRGSERHAHVCEACAEICEACCDSCEEIGGAEMQKCADICRRCAESCREMSHIKPMGDSRHKDQSAGMMA